MRVDETGTVEVRWRDGDGARVLLDGSGVEVAPLTA
ncbi:hypothetical protein SVIOM74S_10568 [Streptomyces violarus]